MPYSSSDGGGPWGGGGRKGGGGRGPWGPGGNDGDDNDRPRRPGRNQGGQVPDIDEIVRKGSEQLKVLMGGRGGSSGGGGQGTPLLTPTSLGIGAVILLAVWLFASVYTVRPEQRSIELFFGNWTGTIGEPGFNFAPWPFVTYEVRETTTEQTIVIGEAGRGIDSGLMLTGDENIVDIDFSVVWNISNLADFLFTLESPEETIRAVAESAMREVIGRSELAPILNRDRAAVSTEVEALIQSTLDSYNSGVNIVRLNLDGIDPPSQVIEAFQDVQAAELDRQTAQNRAEAEANQILADARGRAARLLEEAEGYRASVVNEATGEASRFLAVLQEYAAAPEVTRKRLYLETLEEVYRNTNKIIIDSVVAGGGETGTGVVPFLPLNDLIRRGGVQ